jgi:hypothetical protein
VRRATRTRRVSARFGKSSDLLPSAQMAAMTNYSQAITPESSPSPSPPPSPTLEASPGPISQPSSPMPVDMPTLEPIIHETIPNQLGLYRRFATWPSVDPENDITLDDLTDAPTFINTTDRGYRKAEDAFGPTGASSNPFAPYLNATVYRLMNWFYQTGSKTLNDLNSLVHDVILAPDFDADHLQNFSASSEAKRLDDNPMCPSSDDWHETSIKIRLPHTILTKGFDEASHPFPGLHIRYFIGFLQPFFFFGFPSTLSSPTYTATITDACI